MSFAFFAMKVDNSEYHLFGCRIRLSTLRYLDHSNQEDSELARHYTTYIRVDQKPVDQITASMSCQPLKWKINVKFFSPSQGMALNFRVIRRQSQPSVMRFTGGRSTLGLSSRYSRAAFSPNRSDFSGAENI